MSLWSDIWRQEAHDWSYEPLGATQVPEAIPERDVKAGVDYVTITLKSMRICDTRRGWSKYHGMSQSYVSMPTLDGKTADITAVVSPDALKNVSDRNLDRVLQVNVGLLEEIAYNGGAVGFELGLFSVKDSDLAAPFLSLIETIAEKSGVTFMSALLPFADPLKKGVELLSGTSDSVSLEVGLSTELSPAKTGWFAIMRAPKDKVDFAQLHVSENDFKLVNKKNEPPGRYPYIVFTITASEKKSNWFMVPEISSLYNKLIQAGREGEYDKCKELHATFRRTALSCVDLHRNDAKFIVAQVQEKIEEMLGGGLMARPGGIEFPPLESYLFKKQ